MYALRQSVTVNHFDRREETTHRYSYPLPSSLNKVNVKSLRKSISNVMLFRMLCLLQTTNQNISQKTQSISIFKRKEFMGLDLVSNMETLHG